MAQRQPDSITVEAYAVIVPKWDTHWKDADGHPVLDGARIERVVQSRPKNVRGGGIVTRLRFEIDAAALLPLRPEATIVITPGNTEVIQDLQAEAPEPIVLDKPEYDYTEGGKS